MNKFLTTNEVKEIFRITYPTLWRWIRIKRIPFVRIGKKILFPADELEKWLKKQAEKNFNL
ncbi:MAG: helix-turn-helix domain-containing protein [Candidatus Omnitrophica bacterium]|nr:helix-turn-helix domain-containing protein [Candidatus Omnitrophota bacterium]